MRRTSSSGRRGAVIFETALVTPLLLLIVCGIVEMALLMRADNALTAVVRDAGRSASSAVVDHHDQSRQASQYCAAPACSVRNAPALADVAALTVERAGGALPQDAIDELWVYKANPQGYPGAAGNTGFRSCVSSCVVYRWSPEHQGFDYVSGSWHVDNIDACPEDRDALGVYIKATHPMLSGLFSRGIGISDHAVFSFTALDGAGCSARSG